MLHNIIEQQHATCTPQFVSIPVSPLVFIVAIIMQSTVLHLVIAKKQGHVNLV
jgi:hypothetical protein